jgi:alkylation response protein AidB-like acyl-CoA dehydrogenase
MDYTFPPELHELRAELRRRIAEAFPDGFPSIFVDDYAVLEASADFCRQLGADGLLTMAWPSEYGGAEASLWAQLVVAEEMWGHGEPRGGQYYGVNWIGPSIMAYGTEAQKAEHLPRIARGEGFWAQGYSEPGAGSDLASLRLRATRCEGGWRLSGQKIWTSYGDFAQWIILPARTDPSGPKHQGITVFLLPMDREGIEVRPIPALAGGHEFNEVFFDEVFARDDEVLAEVGHGWAMVEASLGFERIGTARFMRSDRLLQEVREQLLADESSAEADESSTDPHSLGRWVDAALATRVARLLTYRAVAERERGDGGVPAVHGSVHRVANTLNDQVVTSVAMELLSPDSLRGHGEDGVPAGGEIEHEWRHQLAATVAAGTLEIQQIVIAREVLGRREADTQPSALPSSSSSAI